MDTNDDVSKGSRPMRGSSYWQWSFEVVSAPEVNAFALSGGVVRVTDSLLIRLDLPKGEIAGLLAHESGHVSHRHRSP
eukprot:scaffold10260_cov266-Chaetoceros_neogracile.AAC.21